MSCSTSSGDRIVIALGKTPAHAATCSALHAPRLLSPNLIVIALGVCFDDPRGVQFL